MISRTQTSTSTANASTTTNAKSMLQTPDNVDNNVGDSNENTRSIYWIVSGFILACSVSFFAFYFPFMLAPEAASKTFQLAFYEYKESISHFDNTIWTYGTDYGLATVMTILAISIMRCDNEKVSYTVRWRSAGLLLLYAASTLAGGIAHHNFTTFDSRLTWSFRFIWTICVGTVCAASCFMGSIVTDLARQYKGMGPVPIIHEKFWFAYGLTTTIICIYGGMSYQRPACDIFIAGTTQLPSTIYMMVLVALHLDNPRLSNIRRKYRAIGFVGFILNAPLLPAYPLLVQYTDLSLASVNTILHTNLLLAWSMQGISLRHLSVTLGQIKHKPYHAMPVPMEKKVY
jgi:uncharacterized membrane protein YhaH (DUF805 family)